MRSVRDIIHPQRVKSHKNVMNFSSLQLPEIYSIQDQQNQTLNQHDYRHPRDGEQQGFPRLVVIGKPLDLHVHVR